jgi:hypothetical protein
VNDGTVAAGAGAHYAPAAPVGRLRAPLNFTVRSRLRWRLANLKPREYGRPLPYDFSKILGG